MWRGGFIEVSGKDTRLVLYDLPVMAVQEKKDSPDGHPSSLTLVAGAHPKAEKKNPERVVEFTYLATAASVGRREGGG